MQNAKPIARPFDKSTRKGFFFMTFLVFDYNYFMFLSQLLTIHDPINKISQKKMVHYRS